MRYCEQIFMIYNYLCFDESNKEISEICRQNYALIKLTRILLNNIDFVQEEKTMEKKLYEQFIIS